MRIFLAVFIVSIAFCGTLKAQNDDESVRQTDWAAFPETDGTLFSPLSAYGSYFDQATGFGLNFIRFRPRGYDWRYREQRLGGVAFGDWFRGAPAWNAVSGLTGIGTQIYDEQELIPFSVGKNADRRILPWQQQRGGRVGFSTSNRSYVYRGTAAYSSGEGKKGWAYTLFASRSWGDSYMIDGVWNDSWSLFGSVSKRLGRNHRIALTALYTPTERALQSASTAEAQELTGNNLYNPSWGYYGSKKRSSYVRESQQPVFLLTHEFTNSDRLTVTTTAGARFGKESYSNLSWQNAPNPRPDYYRNLPSFQTSPEMQERVAELWRTDVNVRQIDWQSMTDLNHEGGSRAHYITESRVRDYLEYSVQSTLRWQPTERTLFTAGIELLGADNLNFKRLEDLLGADYWLDIDVFAENDEDVRNKTQNNMRDPNRHVREGEEFGYKYSMQTLTGRLWARLHQRMENWDFGITVSGGGSSYRRFGYYEKENFAGDESYRYSPRLTRAEWLFRAEAGYQIGGRFRAGVTLTSQNLMATPRNSFISPEYRNARLPELKNEQILGAELRFDYRTPGFRADLSAFWTQFNDRTDVRSFYDDFNHFYCNYILEGIDTRHLGIEFSAVVQLAPYLSLKAAGVYMDNRYTSNPFATELKESTGVEALTERVYYKDLRVANGPQTVGVLSLEYTPRAWTFSASVNGYANSYIAPTPLRRTLRSTEQAASEEDRRLMLEQERFGGGATLDLFLGRTIYFRDSHRLGLYAGVNNLLNRKDIRTGGYESSRMRYSGTGESRRLLPLDSKYYYALGTNFFVTVNWRF